MVFAVIIRISRRCEFGYAPLGSLKENRTRDVILKESNVRMDPLQRMVDKDAIIVRDPEKNSLVGLIERLWERVESLLDNLTLRPDTL